MAVVAAAAATTAAAAASAARALLRSSPACSSSSRACVEQLLSCGRSLATPSCSYTPVAASAAAAAAVAAGNRRWFSSSSPPPPSFAASASPPPPPPPPPPSPEKVLLAPLVDPATGCRVPGATFPLPADVFGLPLRRDVLHRIVTWQLAKRRRGSGAAKNRAAVSGGGRKPWKQKGTGRARAGSIRSPLWVGGGKAHPPVPRSFEQKCNRKLRRLALATALSARAAEGRLLVVAGGGGGGAEGATSTSTSTSSCTLASDGKTATLARALAQMLPEGARPSALLADGGGNWFEEANGGSENDDDDDSDDSDKDEGGGGDEEEDRPPPSVAAATALRRAAAALPLVEVLSPQGLQPLSILRADFLVMTPEAVEAAARRVRARVKR